MAAETKEEEQPLESITVLATPVAPEEAGASVSILGSAELQRNGAQLLDALREVPGLAVNQSGSSGGITDVRVRGAESNHLLVTIDGIEATDPSTGGLDLTHLLTTDVERVEIVRGPQSALWGSDALAGVMNIITRPDQPAPGTTIMLERGSWNTLRTEASLRYGAGPSHGKLSFGGLSTDGTNVARQGAERDGYRNTTLAAAGRAPLGSALELGYTLRHTQARAEFDGAAGGLPVDAPHATDSELLIAGFSLSQQINGRLSYKASLARTGSERETESSFPSASTGDKTLGRFQFNLAAGLHRIAILAEYEDEYYRQRGRAGQSLNTASLAAEYRLDLPFLNLALGARHDGNSDFADTSSLRFIASWPFGKGSRLFASAGAGVKNPSFTERFAYFGSFVPNPDLTPEESRSYELGASQSFAGGRGHASLALYRADLTDEINGFVFVGSGFSADNKEGESMRQGAELQVAYLSPSERWRLAASYTYLDATEAVPSVNDKGEPNERQVDEIRRPRHAGSVALSYLAEGYGVSLAAAHTGRQFDDDFGSFPARTVALADFTLVTLSAHYETASRATLGLRVENLLNNDDYEQVYGFASPGIAAYASLQFAL